MVVLFSSCFCLVFLVPGTQIITFTFYGSSPSELSSLSMLGLVLLLLFCCAVAFMFLMACVNPNDPTMLGMVARVVTRNIKGTIRSIPVVGPFMLDGTAQFFNYVAFKPNPLLQTVYASLVFGGYGVVLWEAYPQIPNAYMAGYHRYIGVVVVGVTLWAWYKACSVSPGYITHANYKTFDNYPVDNMMYFPDQYYTYKNAEGVEVKPKVPKLPRSKHCSVTDQVIARFDHFCPWLNNAVGERNYKYFLLYLFMTSFMLTYGAAASGSVVMTLITSQKLFAARNVNKVTGEVITASKQMVFQYCMHKQQTMMMLFFLCGIMGIVVFCFFCYHLYLISDNRTTNEGFKWSGYVSEYNYNERKRIYLRKKEIMEKHTEAEEEKKEKMQEQEKVALASTEKKKQTKKKKKGCCPQPFSNFLNIWLHGCFIISCGMCGVEEDGDEKDNEENFDFTGPEFVVKRPNKYMYALGSYKENLMEVFYPRSERTQEERNKMVTWRTTTATGQHGTKKKRNQKYPKNKEKDQQMGATSVKGNWTYFNMLLMERMKAAGQGATIEMVDVKKREKTE